ncbi:C2H2-type domain-containing protein [Abeliophyllum distichum]|uniref:C2H2-type domain-containing protein n=1 Tax=Abeliophyllum distichum TaxID=126358 RepID=A0ABD1Q0R3_9LAMI
MVFFFALILEGREIHGVHLCRRCGWPFPNPHPSARHRRAHKRLCGKIEGYTVNESEPHLAVSDDDHTSDEDHQTPSPKAEKKNIKLFDSSGGAGEKSNKSEDEVFTDAATEFSDSGVSPSLEERLESVVSDKSVEKGMVDDLNRNPLLEADETAKKTEQLNDPTSSSSQMCKLESAMDQLESIVPPSDPTAEAISVGFTNGLQSDSIKSESQTDVFTGNTNQSGDRKMQQELVSAGQFADAKGKIDEEYLKSSESMTLDSEEGKTSDVNVILVDREEKLCDKLDPEVVKHELSPQNETLENKDAFVEVKNDAVNGESDHELELFKSETGQEQMHLLSANLPGIDSPVIPIEDFKDHKYFQSKLPLDLSSAEITRSMEVVDERTIAEEDNLKVEADTYTSRVTSGSVETHGLEVHEVTSGAENHKIQTNCSTQGLQSHSVDPSQDALSEYSPINHCDIISINSSTEEEVKQETNVHRGENASICDINKNDKGVTVGNERSSGDSGDVFCVESKSTPEHADKSFAPKDDQTTMGLVEDSNHYDEKSSSVLLDAGNGSGEVGVVGNLTTNAEAKNGYSMQSLDSTGFSTSDRSVELPISDKFSPPAIHSESLKQHSDEENSCAGGVLESEPVDAAGVGGELNHDGNTEILSENQVKPTLEEQETLPVVKECLNESSAAVENRSTSDNVSTLKSDGIVSGVELIHGGDIVASDSHSPISMSKKPEAPPSDSEVLNKSFATVDVTHITGSEKVSGASSSPTESLEGNWGSVISSQSDITAIAETNSQAAEKSEGNIWKHKAIATEGHLHKSDDFEPPSFGTLVQTADKADEKGSASEIEIAQNAQPPKSEALPEGWFPSITNVVNESEGRKKNEEIIAKVTNWSSGKQHSPLKNLLSEAKSPNPKQVPAANQKDETATKDNGRAATSVTSTLGSGAPDKEMEWNSPARYPTEIKKEKRKGKPYWVPFVCCSSVHRDL